MTITELLVKCIPFLENDMGGFDNYDATAEERTRLLAGIDAVQKLPENWEHRRVDDMCTRLEASCYQPSITITPLGVFVYGGQGLAPNFPQAFLYAEAEHIRLRAAWTARTGQKQSPSRSLPDPSEA